MTEHVLAPALPRLSTDDADGDTMPASDHQELLERAARVADRCAANAAHIDHEGAFPVDEFRWIAEAGLLAAPLAPNQGGAGFGSQPGTWLPLLQLLREIGRGNLAVGRVFEGHVNALQLIETWGTPQQIARYAADVRDHGHVFAVWNTEAADGVKLEPLGDGRFRMHGSKTFASGAGHVARPMVNAALPDGGWQMCIVPMDQVHTRIDQSWWQPLGMRASASYKVDFSGVELEPYALIGAPGDYYTPPWFIGGAIRFAAVHLGGAVALFDAACDYLRGLQRGDDPYQRMRAGEMAIALESGELWLRGAASMAERYPMEQRVDDPAPLHAYANMVRTAIEAICQQVLALAERSVGARGLLRPHPIERISRDLTLYLRQPAPDAALADVGRYVLSQTGPAGKLWPDER